MRPLSPTAQDLGRQATARTQATPSAPEVRSLRAGVQRWLGWADAIPHGAIALVGRIGVAGVFWRSGQTKIEGFQLDLVDMRFEWGLPRLSESAVALFQEEYRLPLLSPELGATLAAWGEHVLPVMLLLGLGTRLSAAGLLLMTLVIQVLVYPGAWPTHFTWAAVLLWLMARGPGVVSVDAVLWRR